MMKIVLLLVLAIFIAGGIGWWSVNSLSNSDAPLNTQQPASNTTDTNNTPEETQNNNATTLDLSGKGLTSVSGSVFTQTNLTELNLSNNALTGALPGEIRQLQNLKKLNLSDNQFTGVPAEIGQLRLLEVLDLSNNQITGLPNELGNLSNLKQLILSGNDYSEADLAGIAERLPNTTVVVN